MRKSLGRGPALASDIPFQEGGDELVAGAIDGFLVNWIDENIFDPPGEGGGEDDFPRFVEVVVERSGHCGVP